MIKHKLFALVTTIIALWLTATSLGRQASNWGAVLGFL